MSWKNTDIENVWHPFSALGTNSKNLLVESAKGLTLRLEDGSEILDMVSSWWVNIHGHGNQELAEVLYHQAKTLEHVIFAGFTHRPALDLVDGLLDILPENQKRVFFSDDGSTSVEVAIKLAIQYWANQGLKKQKIISIEGAYHGDTFGSMSLAGSSAFFAPFEDLLFEVVQIPFPTSDNVDEVVSSFTTACMDSSVGAFIYEPLVQGSAGMRVYDHQTLNTLLGIAKQHEVVCIADEVMTGFGRTGKMFASDYCNHKPDLMCLSKAITGGFMAMGVTVASDRIESQFLGTDYEKTFYHGHSYTANALSCAVAVKSLEMLQRVSTQLAIDEISSKHEVFKRDVLSTFEGKVTAASLGTILRIEIVQDETSYFSNIRDLLYQKFLDRGLLLRPLGNVIYLIPPYVVTDEELKKAYVGIREVLHEVL